MFSLKTLAHLNKIEDLRYHIEENPLTELEEVTQTRHSPDYSGVDLELLEKATGLEIIGTYFVDSSGFGDESEPALTFSNFVNIVDSILEESQSPIYSCLSGVGQFQVYVTLLK